MPAHYLIYTPHAWSVRVFFQFQRRITPTTDRQLFQQPVFVRGMAAKLARNMITFDSWRVTTEAARMAVKMGVKPQALVDGLLACDRQQPDLYYNLIIKRASDENFNLSPGASSYLIPYMQKDL